MKKLFKIMALAILAIAMTACSQSKGEKQGNDGAATEQAADEYSADDYKEMVDYMYEAMETINEINQTLDPSDVQGAQELASEVASDYPDVKEYYEICFEAARNGNSEFEKGADLDKMARIIDCQARGWLRFW